MIDDAHHARLPTPAVLRRPAGLVATAAAVVAFAAGCGLPLDMAPAQHPAATPAEVVWERDLPVVGSVVATADVAVVYTATDDGELTLLGLDPRDGSTLWEHPAGRGAVRPSLSEVEPAVIERDEQILVAYLDPDPAQSSTILARNHLVLADVETGETIGQTAKLSFFSSPERCGDRESVCVWGVHDGRADRAFLDIAAMELRTHPYQFDGYATGSGVRHIDDSTALELVRFTDDGPAWVREVADLPGGSGRSAVAVSVPGGDADWLAVLVRPDWLDTTTPHEVPLRETTMMLLDSGSGEVIWSEEGYPLDCPHHYLMAGVRCHASGTSQQSADEATTYTDLDLTLEGFTADGTTTWTLPIGDDPGPLINAAPRAPGDWLVLRTAQEVVLLDPDTGRTMGVPADWTFLCSETAQIANTVHWDVEEPEEDTWNGGNLYTVCRADGTEIDGPPSVAAVRADGVQSGQVTIVAHPSRVVAYDVPEEDEPASPSSAPAAPSHG